MFDDPDIVVREIEHIIGGISAGRSREPHNG